MTHVLHLVTWLNPGGLEYWLKGFIESTRGTQYQMSVACKAGRKGTLSNTLIENGTHVECCPMLPRLASYPHRLTQLIRNLKVDLIHNHMGAMSLPAIYAARRANVPVITTFHSPQFAPQSALAKFPIVRSARRMYGRLSIHYALKHSNLITGVSHGVLETLWPNYADDPRFRVTYLGLPNRDVSPDENFDIRLAQQWSSEAPLVLSLGRLSAEKNPQISLEVFRQVQAQLPQAKMVFIGQGPMLASLKQTAESFELKDSVAFMGYRNDALRLLTQANVLLHPSNYEGFGLAVIEAAVVGVPAIAADIPGLREAVLHGKTGFLHGVDDQSAMAESIVKLLTNRELSQQFSRDAKAFVEQNFRSDKCQDGILELYRELQHG